VFSPLHDGFVVGACFLSAQLPGGGGRETAGRREMGRCLLFVGFGLTLAWSLGLGLGLGLGFGLILVLILAQSSHHFTLILLFSYLFLIVCTLIGQVRLGGTV
jgi:hypothetical protein